MGKAYQCDQCGDLVKGECQNYIHIGARYIKKEYCDACWNVLLMRFQSQATVNGADE